MISVRFDPDRNALYVSGVMTPFPAGSLEARRLGDMLAVANPHEDALVCAWVRFDGWMVDGASGFASSDEAFAALRAVCNAHTDHSFSFVQIEPALVWTVNHNRGVRPALVTLTTLGGVEMMGDVINVSPNQLIVAFAAPTAGQLRCL